ncbi:C40 family peptidase [Nocardia colli]|uniref:C40 family peptidase n=1 Tax=Nocardia colli TaxID=2545717 RepID=UPI0035D9115D
MGAVAATTGAIPAVTATAATVDVPGVGAFDLPVTPDFGRQVQQAIDDHADQIEQARKEFSATAPQDVSPHEFVDDSAGAQALAAAKTKIGAQYSWGGTGPGKFDCSGLAQWAYRQAGREIPRTSFSQSFVGQPVAFDDLRPGDLIVQNGGSHVALYAGNGEILHASQDGQPVDYSSLDPESIFTVRRIS